jgi:succinate dehydrogenase flavin-adding protein (antitoxin of CptAB toxin-antitoxin module)
MSAADRELERIRWHCRRGLLELDLVLNAFLERHLAALTPRELDTLRSILERPDPELLDFVMAHSDPEDPAERDLVELMRAVSNAPRRQPAPA